MSRDWYTHPIMKTAVYWIAEVQQERWESEEWPLLLGLSKIGIATNPAQRLSAIRTANSHNPLILELLWFHCTSDARKVEREIHRYMRHELVCGEWFSGRSGLEHEALSVCGTSAGYRPDNYVFWDLDENSEMFLIEAPRRYSYAGAA